MTIKKIKHYITHPSDVIGKVNKGISGYYLKYMFPRRCVCSFCGRRFHDFRIHGYDSLLAREHNVTMGFRKSDCPYCGSIDKHRWMWEIIKKESEYLCGSCKKIKVLHFAPEKPIQERLMSLNKGLVDYISGDINEGYAQMVVDMTKMQFKDNSFDLIIASQVLEHVLDENSALKELRRTIKPQGKVILSIPVAFDIEKTKEDLSLSEEERLQMYGQEDHVRLYGMDYLERIKRKSGMNGISYLPKDYYDRKSINNNGYTKAPPILVLQK